MVDDGLKHIVEEPEWQAESLALFDPSNLMTLESLAKQGETVPIIQ